MASKKRHLRPAKLQRGRQPAKRSKNRKTPKIIIRTLFFLLLGFGMLLMFIGAFTYLSFARLSFISVPESVPHTKLASPIRLELPRLGINIPVVEAKIYYGVWQTSVASANHLSSSANPGESGNIIIYGHNTQQLLGNLGSTRSGDQITLFNNQGGKFQYVVSDIKIVAPTEMSVVAPTKIEILTLYTCTGLLDSQRLIVRARPLASE